MSKLFPKRAMRIYYTGGGYYEFEFYPDSTLPAFDTSGKIPFIKEFKKIGRSDGGIVIKKSRDTLQFTLSGLITADTADELLTKKKALLVALRNNGGGNGDVFQLHDMLWDENDVLIYNKYIKAELNTNGLKFPELRTDDPHIDYTRWTADLISGDPVLY